MGSFGWALGNHNDFIWNNKGSAPGLPNPSFRAEGYGMLPMILFIQAYITYHNLTKTDGNAVRLYCNNLALITTVQKLLQYEDYFPALHTWPHYDILNKICISLTHLPISVNIFHVKSHQDKSVPYEELS